MAGTTSKDADNNSYMNGGDNTNNNNNNSNNNVLSVEDTSDLPVWFMDRVCVTHTNGNGEIGVIHETNATNKTATIVLEDKTTITARASDLTLLPPKEHDMVLVTGGADVGVE